MKFYENETSINNKFLRKRATRAYTRGMKHKAICRKKALDSQINDKNNPWYKHDGQYSKGKIRCNCPICKYSKHYNVPSDKDIAEKKYVKQAIEEYYIDITETAEISA